ncbi:MAG: hypothetical protein WD604_15405 [Balneolaceae bacterium]
MDGMERIKSAIEKYKNENGRDYDKILISGSFYEQLHKESSQKGSKNSFKIISSTVIDFPGLEIIKNADYDFKLLP